MVKKFICSFCGVELETFSEQCPHCGEHDVGWIDSAGGHHSGGCGTMPDGTQCGECSFEDCAECHVWKKREMQLKRYGKWYCEECNHQLEVWFDHIEEECPAEGDGFCYERHHLIWHCPHCGRDYENYWETQWGDTMISKLQRKMWG